MISNTTELSVFLESLNCGTSLFEVVPSQSSLHFKPAPFKSKDEMRNSSYWLHKIIGAHLSRTFNAHTKRWGVESNTIRRVQISILDDLLDTIAACSDSKAADRTLLYKDYRVINARNSDNSEYLSSVIAILNYYHSASTDQTCRSNVIGLLNILRKKYGTPSRN